MTALSIDGSVNAIVTSGYASTGDDGHALYVRVGSEPSHAFKVQSLDGAWWEGVPEENGVWPEQFGAVNGLTGDNTTTLQSWFDYLVSEGVPGRARGSYRVDSTGHAV